MSSVPNIYQYTNVIIHILMRKNTEKVSSMNKKILEKETHVK